MFDSSYTQTLQDQIGQLSKLLGGQAQAMPETQTANGVSRYDCVDGIEGARSFLGKMLPGTKHIVWDSRDAVFYVLQKDANNTAERIQIGKFTIELEPTMEERYVTKEDFQALVARLEKLIPKEGTDNA